MGIDILEEERSIHFLQNFLVGMLKQDIYMISENYRILFNRPTGELFAEEKMEHILP